MVVTQGVVTHTANTAERTKEGSSAANAQSAMAQKLSGVVPTAGTDVGTSDIGAGIGKVPAVYLEGRPPEVIISESAGDLNAAASSPSAALSTDLNRQVKISSEAPEQS